MHSCLYTGRVRHRRTTPLRHAFDFPLFMAHLDLAELPEAAPRLWPARFERADYLGEDDVPLDQAVRDLVEARTGRRPRGAISLVTHPRQLGYVFNPLSLYYCFEAGGDRVETLVAEVTNIPWKERHAYVLPVVEDEQTGLLEAFDTKVFHVSPFMDMKLDYRFRTTAPGRRLHFAIDCFDRTPAAGPERPFFHASLSLRRQPLTRRGMWLCMARHPWMTAQITAGIYWQALRLRRKGAPTYPHPDERESPR